MAKFVPDIKSNRWVVIAPTRVLRPHDNPPSQGSDLGAPQSHLQDHLLQKASEQAKPVCPFCPGQESLNKTVFSVGNVRVIANKYPITDFHEVIIHSPDHEKDIDELPTEQVELILNVYRQRYNYYKEKGTVMIFNNHDIHAGASLAHPHSQLVVVPKQINLDTMSREPVQNEVVRTKHFVAYCPDFSQWPYEIWLAPNGNKSEIRNTKYETNSKNQNSNSQNVSDLKNSDFGIVSSFDIRASSFGDITDDQIADLAPLLQKILGFICKKFKGEDDVPYNYYIYHGNDWYLRIIPRLIHRAGFELGTGLSVNIVDPTVAAKEYKEGIAQNQ